LVRADKKATTSGFFSGPKRDEAAELYVKAANSFKLAKSWKEAGDAYLKAAQMQILMGERDEAAQMFIAASKCFKKCLPQEAINSLKQAVEILTDQGRLHQAANHMKDIGIIYESDLLDLEKSSQAYETAGDWYATEEAASLANGCFLKVATFAAQLERYDKAIQTFEQVATSSADNNMSKWSLKDYFLKAGLCYLAMQDSVGLQRAIERYCALDATFSTTRECRFLLKLGEVVDAGDVEQFTELVVEYDTLTKLDTWKTTLLLRVKKSVSEDMALT